MRTTSWPTFWAEYTLNQEKQKSFSLSFLQTAELDSTLKDTGLTSDEWCQWTNTDFWNYSISEQQVASLKLNISQHLLLDTVYNVTAFCCIVPEWTNLICALDTLCGQVLTNTFHVEKLHFSQQPFGNIKNFQNKSESVSSSATRLHAFPFHCSISWLHNTMKIVFKQAAVKQRRNFTTREFAQKWL